MERTRRCVVRSACCVRTPPTTAQATPTPYALRNRFAVPCLYHLKISHYRSSVSARTPRPRAARHRLLRTASRTGFGQRRTGDGSGRGRGMHRRRKATEGTTNARTGLHAEKTSRARGSVCGPEQMTKAFNRTSHKNVARVERGTRCACCLLAPSKHGSGRQGMTPATQPVRAAGLARVLRNVP
jgi:hypothetical protein